MMQKLIEWALGPIGVIVFVIVAISAVAVTSGSTENEESRCEARGGKLVQVMKTYHECRIPQSN